MKKGFKMIKNVSNVSFKGYVPVRYYAKNPATGKYSPVVKNENIKKCNSFVVRNLNGTLKKNKNEDFVDFFRSHDSDYRRLPVVHSVYDQNAPVVYLITGKDADTVREMAKPIGRAKGEALDKTGCSKSFEVSNASNDFFRNVKAFMKNGCRRLKSEEGDNLSLRVYFDPKYNKKNNLTGFDFVNARFLTEE